MIRLLQVVQGLRAFRAQMKMSCFLINFKLGIGSWLDRIVTVIKNTNKVFESGSLKIATEERESATKEDDIDLLASSANLALLIKRRYLCRFVAEYT